MTRNGAAFEAFRRGQLSPPPRAPTIRDASDYEQDLSVGAEMRERKNMVQIIVHMETTSPTDVSWWAESPDVPGFTAAAPSLPELVCRTEAALPEVGAAGSPEYELSLEGAERPGAVNAASWSSPTTQMQVVLSSEIS